MKFSLLARWYCCTFVLCVVDGFRLNSKKWLMLLRDEKSMLPVRLAPLARQHSTVLYSTSSIPTISDKSLKRHQWTTVGYRKPLHWVQKVAHLEDALDFYNRNFNFNVLRHEEFSSGCEATCNGPYGGAWSKTMIGPGPSESESFCLELVCNYGVHRYERGMDLRSIAIIKSAFVGDNDLVGMDDNGLSFVRTPDGHFIQLVEEITAVNHMAPRGVKSQKDAIRHISIHVTNLTASIASYQHILGASVVVNETSNTAICTWDKLPTEEASISDNKDIVSSHVGIELHPLPAGTEMILGAAQGRFAIETDDFAVAEIAQRAQQAESLGMCKVLHGPVKLQPHGEEVVIIADADGHEYCFVDARGFQTCMDVSNTKNGNIVDWEYRQKINDKASIDYMGDRNFGPHIQSIEPTEYTNFLEKHRDYDVVLDMYAPWCILCAKRKPIYQELARRVLDVHPGKVIFAMMDPTKIPFTLIQDDTLEMLISYAKSAGYPTLSYIPASHRSNPDEFTGNWNMVELRSWIEQQSKGTGAVDLSGMDMTVLPSFTDNEEEEDEDDDDCNSCQL